MQRNLRNPSIQGHVLNECPRTTAPISVARCTTTSRTACTRRGLQTEQYENHNTHYAVGVWVWARICLRRASSPYQVQVQLKAFDSYSQRYTRRHIYNTLGLNLTMHSMLEFSSQPGPAGTGRNNGKCSDDLQHDAWGKKLSLPAWFEHPPWYLLLFRNPLNK